MSDVVWLPDVLRDEGLPVVVSEGAFNRGHGDMLDIWGVFDHHTGSNNASWQSIAFHPTLGLASQLHLSQQGLFTVCGVGIAWHAGSGSWPGLGTNNANPRTIGIEAANDAGGSPPGRRDAWPAVQYDNYVRGNAAILRHLGRNSSFSIGHKEWAGTAQGKWDPGGIDMRLFRNDIQSLLGAPPTTGDDDLTPDQDKMLREVHDKLLAYPDVPQIAGKWRSRAWCRGSDGGVDDTVGIELYTNAHAYDLIIAWSAVELRDSNSVNIIKRLASGEGPERSPAAIEWARRILDKIAT